MSGFVAPEGIVKKRQENEKSQDRYGREGEREGGKEGEKEQASKREMR